MHLKLVPILIATALPLTGCAAQYDTRPAVPTHSDVFQRETTARLSAGRDRYLAGALAPHRTPKPTGAVTPDTRDWKGKALDRDAEARTIENGQPYGISR